MEKKNGAKKTIYLPSKKEYSIYDKHIPNNQSNTQTTGIARVII
jgi:hypothetical protein